MRTVHWFGVVVLAVVVTAAVTQRVTAMRTAVTAPATPALVGTVKEIMEGIVDPASDVLFESVSTISSAAGVVEHKPTTADEWANVKHNALMLAEAANLLTMAGRHVGRPTDPVLPSSPDAPELTAEQVEAKIAADPALWVKHVTELQTVAVEAMKAIDAKSVDGMYEVGDKIDKACESCHLQYWYPEEKKTS